MKYSNERRFIRIGTKQVKALSLAAVLGLAAVAGATRSGERFGGEGSPAEPTARAAVEEGLGALALEEGVREEPREEAAWDLPNLEHERVDYFVRVFSGRQRKMFTRYLTRMGHYQPMISEKLAEREMPQDLIYLAMIESGFDPKAYSHAHASGLWQFIAGTGQRYGLDINRAVDERRDPEKATDAALSYLQDLHAEFGSWYLAAAAYNTGEGRVRRIMRQETGSVRGDEYSYYRIRHRLPRETRDYVPLMVAAARIAKEPHRYGFEDVQPGAPLAYEGIEVAPATPLANVARAAGTSVAEIRRLNPQLKLSRTRNDRSDVIRVPAGTRVAFEENWPKVRAERVSAVKEAAKAPSVKRYRIRRGDNLSRIARRHGVSVGALKRANGLRGDRIRAGRILRIPVSG